MDRKYPRHIILDELPYRVVGCGHNACIEVYNPEGTNCSTVDPAERMFVDYPGIVRHALKSIPDDAFITIGDYHS